jgi:hypothetical protein
MHCQVSSFLTFLDTNRKSYFCIKFYLYFSVYDSAGKLPAGILDGNINQFGNMDQCLQSGGRYCLTQIYIKVSEPWHKKLDMIDKRMHSYFLFKGSSNEVFMKNIVFFKFYYNMYSHLRMMYNHTKVSVLSTTKFNS